MCGVGLMDYPLSVGLLLVAAILGDQSNFTIGRYLGPKVFKWENSRLFNKAAFDAAHAFYEKYGGITIVAARFMPFLRTFAPFVAGVAEMPRTRQSDAPTLKRIQQPCAAETWQALRMMAPTPIL